MEVESPLEQHIFEEHEEPLLNAIERGSLQSYGINASLTQLGDLLSVKQTPDLQSVINTVNAKEEFALGLAAKLGTSLLLACPTLFTRRPSGDCQVLAGAGCGVEVCCWLSFRAHVRLRRRSVIHEAAKGSSTEMIDFLVSVRMADGAIGLIEFDLIAIDCSLMVLSHW